MNYNVYSNGGSGPIDYATPIGATTGLTFTTDALAYPNTWRFAVRADDGTAEELNIDAAVRIVLDAAGADATDLPLAPVGLSAWPVAGGAIRATWSYPGSTAGLIGFRVYVGSPSPDYGTAAATVAASARIRGSHAYQADIPGLSDGVAYAVAVRAYNATGEEANANTVTATAAATGPDAVVGLTISTDPADW